MCTDSDLPILFASVTKANGKALAKYFTLWSGTEDFYTVDLLGGKPTGIQLFTQTVAEKTLFKATLKIQSQTLLR